MLIRTRSQVRITVGNTCGSGGVVFNDDEYSWILTNAHVVGTQNGRVVNVDSYFHKQRGPIRREGIVIFAAYRQGTSVDLAIVRCPRIEDSIAVPISINGRCDENHGQTGGSPRCEWTSFHQVHYTRNDLAADIYYWVKNSIGGQSGSSVTNYNGNRVEALLTWTNGQEGMGQSGALVTRVLREKTTEMATPLPPEAKVACDNPQKCDDIVSFEAADFPDGMFTDCQAGPDPDPDPDPDPIDPRDQEIIEHATKIIELAMMGEQIETSDLATILQILLEILPIIIDIIRRNR